MNPALPQEVARRLYELKRIETWAQGIYDAMTAPPGRPSNVEPFVTITRVPGLSLDFDIDVSGRAVRAHFRWFTRKEEGNIVAAGRYSFYMYRHHPAKLEELEDDPLWNWEFGSDGTIKIGEDNIQIHPSVPEYRDEKREILLVYIAEEVLKNSFE